MVRASSSVARRAMPMAPPRLRRMLNRLDAEPASCGRMYAVAINEIVTMISG
ncbi:hypothetical protein D3C85_1774790 [compost metagenome]